MRPICALLVITSILFPLGGTASAADKAIESTAVMAVLRERLEKRGFTLITKVRGTHIGFAGGSSGYKGTFLFGEAREYEVPKYIAERGVWKRVGTTKPKIDPASVTFEVGHLNTRKKLPISLKEVVRKPREASGKEIKLGKAPKLEVIRHGGQWSETFESARRAGVDVERLIVRSTAPGTRIVGSAGHQSLKEVARQTAPLRVRIQMRYHYNAERFGQLVPKILQVRININNRPKDRIPLKPIYYLAMEDAVLWAIAEVAGFGHPADRPPIEDALTEVPSTDDAGPPDTPPEPMPTPITERKPPKTPVAEGFPGVVAVMVRAGTLEADLTEIRAQLRAGVVALEAERGLLADVRRTLELMDGNNSRRSFYENWAKELETTIAGLEQEREHLLRDARMRWDLLRRDLDEVIAIHNDHAGIREELQTFRGELELKEELSELMILLAAGKTDTFNARLPAALKNPDLAESAMQLRIADFLERDKIAEALYAARVGAARHPKNETFALFVRDLESGYLKTIADKAAGDGARLRVLWDEYAGADDSVLWQAFFGGLKHAAHAVTGTQARLETILTKGVDRAAMEHNGIELMRRLRDQGLSFDEIEKLDHYELRDWMIRLAPKRGPPTDRTVENFTLAIAVAFQNEDVKRLRAPGKALMQVSTRSYYSAEEFDEHWGGVLDAISAKNVLMIFGPAATLGAPGWLARVATRMGRGGRFVAAASSHRAAGLTAGEWIYSAPRAQRIAQAVANSRAGPSLANARHALRGLRYHDQRFVRWGTATAGFTGHVAGNWLLMEGAGYAGEQMGGEYGRIAGELMSGFVGLPGVGSTARLQQRVKRSHEALKQARAQTSATEALLRHWRVSVHDAAESLARGQALSATAKKALERAATTAEDVAERARRAAAQSGSRLVQGAADEADALAASARAKLAGRADDALGASQAARAINKQVQVVKRSIEKAEKRLAQTLRESVEEGPTLTMERGVRAPGSKPPVHGDPVPPRTRIPQVGSKADLPRPPGPPPAPALLVDEFERRAALLMKNGRHKDAASVLHVALRHPQAKGPVLDRLQAAFVEATGAARARPKFASWARGPNAARLRAQADEAMDAFTEAERTYMKGLGLKNMPEINPKGGAGGARYVPDANGNTIAAWKPGNRLTLALSNDGQITAEVLTSRLGRRMKMLVPHAEPLKVDGQQGVVIRWVKGSSPLENMAPGARAALKEQVAAFRPLHTLMGNYDTHLGNYVVDRTGRVWAIDAGQSVMTSPQGYNLAGEVMRRGGGLGKTRPQGVGLSEWADAGSGGGFGIRSDVSESINWTRWFRDWYASAGSHKPAQRMHRLASGADMATSARRLQAVTPAELAEDIAAAVARSPESAALKGGIFRTLLERQKNLKLLLDEHWPGALP